ncbi:P-loop containing nucleoside triphosphate hydrolase protein [Infundibulicybe gibba]|nr:P-loop containing nucleoside triphosphate hydrolase protein [Infundibulicybe gibba]
MFFDLPRITVIGGQSAGKSSLVEAVSGINVPRDPGTCTRCPMECTMSSSATSWSCQISLRIEYDSGGRQLEVSNTTLFGPCLTDKGTVELWLRRAQAAILHPHLQPSFFLDMDEATLRQLSKKGQDPDDAGPRMLQFSRNTVLVDVKDPDIVDLSFTDLPGLIQNESVDTIEMVRELVVSHISGQNTLILITIPMSDDMQNQEAVRLAKSADPDGTRIIGVLTKPDTLTAGAIGLRQLWRAVIEGQEHPLKHGYYCVRLPDDAERARKLSPAERERAAANFFDNTSPWTPAEIPDRKRFGIPNFVTDISRLLVGLIEKNLPNLRRSVDDLLRKCVADLEDLPPRVTTEPSAEVLLRVTSFCREFSEAVSGTSNKSFAQGNRSCYAEFKADIYQTRPNFRPIAHDEEYLHPSLIQLDLRDVRDCIANSVGWELPGFVPFDATKDLVARFTSLWREPSLSCLDDIFATTSAFVDTLLVSHFGQFKPLENHIRSLTNANIEECREESLTTLEKFLAFETAPLYTQNIELLESQRNFWRVQYRWKPTYEPEADQYPDERELMANVQAYFHVSSARIIDYVPLLIEHELHQRIATSLQQSLFDRLLEDPKKMTQLLDEDPVIADKRRILEGKKSRLLEIKEKLDAFRSND